MKLIKICLIGLLLTGCGVKIKGIPSKVSVNDPKVKVGPDFEAASSFCDSKYGAESIEAEECFDDFRNYFNVSISLDLDNIVQFCEDRYETQIEIDECIDEFTALLEAQTEI